MDNNLQPDVTADTKTATTVAPKVSWFWIKDTAGYPSVTVTLLVVSFVITTMAFLISMVESIGTVKFRAFDTGACTAYFVPILTLYFGRKWTDAKQESTKNEQA